MGEPTSPHVGDELVELALGHVGARRRAELAAHLLECPGCRHEYDEVSAAISDVTTAVPAVQPPVGFDAQVLARISEASTPRRPRRARRWLAVAAAALVLLAAAGAFLVLRAGDDSELATVVPLRLDDGDAVGTVSLREVDGEPVMVVALTDAPADVSYTCRMRLRDGTVVDSDPWPAVANGAWIVGVPGGAEEVERVDLVVTGTDHVWSSARL